MEINVVSMYVDRPEHPRSRDYRPFLALNKMSCERFGYKQVVMSDDDIPGFNTFRTDLPRSLMPAVNKAIADYLSQADGPTLITGAHCVIAKDIRELFDLEFDVMCNTHPYVDCILNTGFMLIKEPKKIAPLFYEALKITGDDWSDDQRAIATILGATLEHGLYDRNGIKVRFVPMEPYHVVPDDVDDRRDGYVFHFRGPRKDWMPEYCLKHLGYGTKESAGMKPLDLIVVPNASESVFVDNIKINSARGLQVVYEKPAHNGNAVICGSGPSLVGCLDEIKRRQELGQTVFALNNSANFLKGFGIKADYQIILDAKEHNKSFLCGDAFLLGSQCHPSLFDEALKMGGVILWHALIEDCDMGIPDTVPYTLVGGGTTVGLSSMCLAYVLGYRKIHLYGYDSCGRHVTPQEQNAKDRFVDVEMHGRWYKCSEAMYAQASRFFDVANNLAERDTLITVHGSGLIPDMVNIQNRLLGGLHAGI